MNITKDIKYVGVFDSQIDLFEGQYLVPDGISYNSYAIIDDKVAVMDSVDAAFTDEWLRKLDESLEGRAPDYLVVQHMEPDHSASIEHFTRAYPDAKIVASAKAFTMMGGFFGTDFPDRQIVVGEGSTLSLGRHTLSFITAPMVHWPEVIMTYDASDKVLFSADGFGRFGSTEEGDGWADEARRYYIGIVGKYGAQVSALLKKAAALEIEKIAPLHGPVLNKNLAYYIELYDKWSSYTPEEDGVVIAYTSVYGNTKKAALALYEMLTANGKTAVIYDLARCDMSRAVADAFRYSSLVLATTTYNADVFPFMREFIDHLTERNFKSRRVGFIENGSWAPMATKVMRGLLEGSKDISYTESTVRISSALSDESYAQLTALADELCR